MDEGKTIYLKIPVLDLRVYGKGNVYFMPHDSMKRSENTTIYRKGQILFS